MYYCCFRLFLLAALLVVSSGESSVHGPPQTVLAFVGGDVILPCSFNITANDDVPTVEWSKEGLQPDVVLLYRDGCETHEMKNPAFRYRTSLIMKELQNGNISLRISNVQLADAGKYRCMRLRMNVPRDISAVELVVGAVSEPKVSVRPAEGGGVTLQCEASCWLPEPQVDFLDDQGNYIRADDSKGDEDASGCFTVTRRVTLQDALHRVTCRVHQPQTNQTRDSEILITGDGGRSCLLTAAIAVGVTVLLLLAPSCGLAVFLWKKFGKSAEGQKLPVTRQPSDQSTTSGSSEHQLLLPTAKPVGADITIEMLTVEMADLKSKLHEREETIHHLQNNNSSQISPVVSQPTVLCSPAASTNRNPPNSVSVPEDKWPRPGIPPQKSSPAPDPPIRRFRRNHSSPACLNFAALSNSFSASASDKKLGRTVRSMSDSSRPVTKLQRRHSSVLPTPSNKHFMLLADLTEESD